MNIGKFCKNSFFILLFLSVTSCIRSCEDPPQFYISQVHRLKSPLAGLMLEYCPEEDKLVILTKKDFDKPVKIFFDNLMYTIKNDNYKPANYLKISYGAFCKSFKNSTMQDFCQEVQKQSDDLTLILTYYDHDPRLGQMMTVAIIGTIIFGASYFGLN